MVTGDGLGVTLNFYLYSSMRARVYAKNIYYPSLRHLINKVGVFMQVNSGDG